MFFYRLLGKQSPATNLRFTGQIYKAFRAIRGTTTVLVKMASQIRFLIPIFLCLCCSAYVTHTSLEFRFQVKDGQLVAAPNSSFAIRHLKPSAIDNNDDIDNEYYDDISNAVTMVTPWDKSDPQNGTPKDNIPLYIMTFCSVTVSANGWSSAGVIPALEMAVYDVNHRNDILAGYELVLLIKDSQVK